MRANFALQTGLIRGLLVLGAVVVVMGIPARAQVDSANDGWQKYDWLKPAEDQKQQAAAGSVTSSTGQNVKDPFAVLSTGALWQEKTSTLYSRRMADTLTLNYESSSTLMSESSNPNLPLAGGTPDDLSHGQKVSLQFQPTSVLTFRGDVHASTTDNVVANTPVTSGANVTTETHLPTNTVLIFGANSDRTGTESTTAPATTTTAYDAQLSQPVGNLPLSAILKGHYEEMHAPGAPPARTPSLEQSLTWKPVTDTTLQLGLRQQQYQEYPGIDNQFNQAIFADLSRKVLDNVTWHSYGELLNTRGLVDQAPASPLASGAYGTPQATEPGSDISPTSSVPLTFQDQTLTFSTGPSFQLQKDISASVEYSNRWDKNPAPGAIGQEQRVSLSVKGSF